MAVDWEWLRKKNFRLDDTRLHPTLVNQAWDAILELWKQGIYVLITQGYRSIQEQNELYAQGRTKPGKIVTNAKGGTSYHNYGLALDFALYTKDGKDAIWDDSLPEWKKVVTAFKKRGFEWGGDFRSFKDTPHFQMTFGFSISQLKAGKRPEWHGAVKVPVPQKQVATIVKEVVESMTPEQANKAIAYLSKVYVAYDKDSVERKIAAIVADTLRVAIGKEAVNGYEKPKS